MNFFGKKTTSLSPTSLKEKGIKNLTDKIIESKENDFLVDMSNHTEELECAGAVVTLVTNTCDSKKKLTFKISKNVHNVFKYSGITSIINFEVA